MIHGEETENVNICGTTEKKRGGKEDKNAHIGMTKKKNRRADDEFWTKRKSHEIYNWSTGKRRSWLGWANVSRERMERTEFF